jgi:hypothetical protein
MLGRSRLDFESVPGSIPVGDCGNVNGMAEPAAGEPVVLFLPANIAHQFVGISVGIDHDRRRKLLQIQMIMRLNGYRPGADGYEETPALQPLFDNSLSRLTGKKI